MSPPRPDCRPLAAAAVTAFISVGLLALAIGSGWLRAGVGRGANFCEAARNGPLRQPTNTLSNAGFVAAGLAIAWFARRLDQLGPTLPRYPGLATGYAWVVVLLGRRARRCTPPSPCLAGCSM